MSGLASKRCVPCEGGVPPLGRAKAEELLAQVPGWTLSDDARSISRTFSFRNFKEALDFVNRVGALAESEGHHPDIALHGWKHVTLALSTHAIGGLSENDFVLAAKIDKIR